MRIQPDVLFLEITPAVFEDHYENCSQQNLELMAVRQYRQRCQVKLVPVDLPAPSADFVSNLEELRRRIRRVSPEYCRLMQLDDDCVREYGFDYLNSERCGELWARVYEDIVSAIKRMNDDPRLVAIYRSWMEKNDLREKAMMEKIHKYCSENTFNKGVFLVGAAHRRPIIDISKEQSEIQWDFAGYGNRESDA